MWPLIFAIVGFAILTCGVVIRRKLNASEYWPNTSGTILESSVEPGWSRDGSGRIYIVKPKVIYKYHVSGEDYTSSQLALVEVSTASENLARAKAEKYKVGQNVVVYYDPQKPNFATLQVGDPTGGKLPFVIMIFGLGFIIAGMVWLLSSHR
ncbi:MAG TPA: DUF3592 domain-containing protein [Candidatus Sulfotelmatobacter sp.]|jgi:hypothetical protein|nr:DUF3592 domain-containing protein [Candidatus Sulfotelmatobacter sp.]